MTFGKLASSVILAAAVLFGGGVLVDRRATAREAAAEAAFPPTGQLLQLGKARVHAHVEGKGPDLVLIHGASGNTRDFTFAMVQELARDWRVIVFDRPGLGWSDSIGDADADPAAQAAVLWSAAQQLGVRQPVVLGHSYGAAVAMARALDAPPDQRPAALVIVSGATMPWPGDLGTYYRVTGHPIGQAVVVPAIAAFAPEAQVEATIREIFAPDPVPEGYAGHVGAGLTLRRETLRANARQVTGLKPHVSAMSQRYATLTMPVEILHGTADTIVPADVHALPLSRLVPGAELRLIPGAGHMPHHAYPEAVYAALSRAASRAGLHLAAPIGN